MAERTECGLQMHSIFNSRHPINCNNSIYSGESSRRSLERRCVRAQTHGKIQIMKGKYWWSDCVQLLATICGYCSGNGNRNLLELISLVRFRLVKSVLVLFYFLIVCEKHTRTSFNRRIWLLNAVEQTQKISFYNGSSVLNHLIFVPFQTIFFFSSSFIDG